MDYLRCYMNITSHRPVVMYQGEPLEGFDAVIPRIAAQTLANPTVGIRIVTSGDAVDVSLFQHEVGAFVTSAIPTTSANVIRDAEIMSYSASNNMPLTAPGTIYCIATPTTIASAGTNRSAMTTYNAANNTGVWLGINTPGTTNPRAIVANGANTFNSVSSGDAIAAGIPKRMALVFATDDCQHVTSGIVRGTTNSAAMPTSHTAIRIGVIGSNAQHMFGACARVMAFSSRLSAFALARLY